MSIQTCIKQAATEKLGPLASAIILNTDFSQGGSFQPYFAMLQEELMDVQSTANFYLQQERAEMLRLELGVDEGARGFVLLIQSSYGSATAVASSSAATPSTPAGKPLTPTLPGVPSSVAVPFYVGREPRPNAGGSNACFARGCGKKFLTFNDAIAHKVLAHGYIHPKYTKSWAEGVVQSLPAGLTVPLGAPSLPTITKEEDEQDPNKRTASAAWVPKLNLNLDGLGLAPGEASRFAVGDDEDARFYFIRRVPKRTNIKGKFVWTKFAHQFNSEVVETDDFVVRKMAGDTKEWIGMQRKRGVYNVAYNHVKTPGQRYVHQDVYVGEYEADIEAILADPHKARVRYGKLIGACGYCGRKLTDAESRRRGTGPDCHEAKGQYARLKIQAGKFLATGGTL